MRYPPDSCNYTPSFSIRLASSSSLMASTYSGDALCHFLGCLHRQDHGLRTVNHISSGKDTTAGSHTERTLHHLYVALLIHLDTCGGRNDAVGRTGTDGEINSVEVLNSLSIRSVQHAASCRPFLPLRKASTVVFHSNLTPSFTASSYSLWIAGISSWVLR